jgi:hypothetical protein
MDELDKLFIELGVKSESKGFSTKQQLTGRNAMSDLLDELNNLTQIVQKPPIVSANQALKNNEMLQNVLSSCETKVLKSTSIVQPETQSLLNELFDLKEVVQPVGNSQNQIFDLNNLNSNSDNANIVNQSSYQALQSNNVDSALQLMEDLRAEELKIEREASKRIEEQLQYQRNLALKAEKEKQLKEEEKEKEFLKTQLAYEKMKQDEEDDLLAEGFKALIRNFKKLDSDKQSYLKQSFTNLNWRNPDSVNFFGLSNREMAENFLRYSDKFPF